MDIWFGHLNPNTGSRCFLYVFLIFLQKLYPTFKKKSADWTVLEIHGNIDPTTVNVLHGAIEGLDKNADKYVRLDFKNVSYISSVGLREVLILRKRYTGDRMEIVNVMPEVKQVFQTAGFADHIKIKGGTV